MVYGLPPEAACWEQETIHLERMDEWFHTLVGVQSGRKVTLPQPLSLATRGRVEKAPPPKKKASKNQILAWFSGLKP